MYQPSAPSCPPPSDFVLPPGWTSHWSVEHQRAYYINNQTGESTWNLPSPPPQDYQPNPSIQRKPVGATSTPWPISSDSGDQENHMEQLIQSQHRDFQHQRYPQVTSYPSQPNQIQYTPPYSPPQQRDAGGYFPIPSNNQAGKPNQLYPASPDPSRYSPGLNQSGLQQAHNQTSVHVPQQYFPPPPMHGSQQGQPRESFAQSAAYPAVPPFQQSNARQSVYYPPPAGQANYNPQHFSPPLTPAATPSWQQNHSQTGVNSPQSYAVPSHQPQYHNKYGQPAPQGVDQSRKSSGGMLSKLGSKFGQLQKAAGSGSTASPLKKWGTRAALGIGAIGAVALGADMMDGSLFDGGASSAFDASSAQEAIDANAVQHALEQQGQENALMLLDPPGTEYTVVQGSSLI